MRVQRGAMAWALMAALMLGASSTASATVNEAKPKRTTKTTFVAPVPGTDSYIGIVVGKRSAVAYLCDGEKLDEWLTGATTNGIVALESQDGSALVARRAGNKLRGTIVLPDNRTLRFDAVPARGKAGLFRRVITQDGVLQEQTWIRLADGTARGAGNLQSSSQLEDLIQSGVITPPSLLPLGPLEPPPPADPTPDDTSAPPQEPAPCPPDTQLVGDACVEIPPIDVPAQPPGDAVTPTPPPVEQTIAGRVTDLGGTTRRGPTEVPLPEPDAFDDAACARIVRALGLLADELDTLEPQSATGVVFASVFSHLRDRGALGGCQGLVGVL